MYTFMYSIRIFVICFMNYKIVKSIIIECIATINVNGFALKLDFEK